MCVPTSWQHLPTVLQGEGREAVLGVDPHDPVAQSLHGQDPAARGARARPARSAEKQQTQQMSLFSFFTANFLSSATQVFFFFFFSISALCFYPDLDGKRCGIKDLISELV